VVTGDTKVVEQGKGDGVFITTTGIGALPAGRDPGGAQARPGDVVLLSGRIGDHGMAIMAQRESLAFDAEIVSDSAALHMASSRRIYAAVPAAAIRVLRDPTRGGLATTLNEIATQSGVGMMLEEAAIPVAPQVHAACELLGLDPLYVANEGKLVVLCAPRTPTPCSPRCARIRWGTEAARIGAATADAQHFVQMAPPSAGAAWWTGCRRATAADLLNRDAYPLPLLIRFQQPCSQRLYVASCARRGHEVVDRVRHRRRRWPRKRWRCSGRT
jgi:hydrogenase expression/formation protein HypE